MRINRGGFNFIKLKLIVFIVGLNLLSVIVLLRPKQTPYEIDSDKIIGLCLFLSAIVLLLFYLITDYKIKKKRKKIMKSLEDKEKKQSSK